MSITRRYPDAPRIGVGVVIFNDVQQVLLVQRAKPPRAGQWSIPGGMLDLGEKLPDAARREVREECSIEIELGDVAAIYEPIFLDNDGRVEYHYVLIDYWAKHRSGEVRAGDDAAAVAWVELSAIDRYALHADTNAVIQKAFKLMNESLQPQYITI
jgi:ADP-ribose pyrophosphatase YjhB (NUDIX family)